METICTTDITVVEPLIPELAEAYADAFKPKPWEEVSKCARPDLAERTRCVGSFSSQAIGELCVDCQMRPTMPAYTEAECREMFTSLLERGAAYYIERDERGVLMTTIGVAETVGELVRSKYADAPRMAEWLVRQLDGEGVKTTYMTESFANLALRPSGNMKERGKSVRAVVDKTGQRLVTTRTISPAVIAATLRDFPDAKLYLPDEDNQSAWNAGLRAFADRAVGVAPDRRAFIIWEVE